MKNLNLKIVLSLGFLLVGGSGCTRLMFPRQLADTNFQINLVEQAPGTYDISGATNFSEDSKVAVAAIRSIRTIATPEIRPRNLPIQSSTTSLPRSRKANGKLH
jgi:hypothetical protein